MQLSPEQQKAIDAQKEQCPFCKIIKGDIPSKKVWEDEKVIAILDINPAAKGHVLLMPKEHYPIMPLIPPETFEHLFLKTKQLSAAMKEGLLSFGNTIFIANGYAAGQQSSHFMLHIIPREETDGMDFFTLKKGHSDRQKTDEAYKLLAANLPVMLRQRYAKFPIPGQEASKEAVARMPATVQPTMQETATRAATAMMRPTAQLYSKDAIIKLIESNEQLKQFIIDFPDQFKEQVQSNPKLKKVFENIDLDEIIAIYAPTKQVSKYSMNELVQIVNDNPKLKELLLKQTFQFAEQVQKVPELKEIFGGVDVEELERAVLGKEVREEQDVKELLTSIAKLKKPREEPAEEPSEEEQEIISPKKPMQKKGTPKEPHLEIPETENPAFIQEEDESVQELEEEDRPEEEQKEAKQQKKKENHKEEKEKPEGADLDLISRLHREMLGRK